MDNSNYWIQKAKENFIKNEKASDKAVSDMFQSLEEVALEIEDKINAFYNKYATDNNLTITEAKKMISSKEYSVWRKSISEYISESQYNSKILLELNTLSTKSQISREEKLLADIYLYMLELASAQEQDLNTILEDVVITNYSATIANLKTANVVSGGFISGKLDKKALTAIINYKWSEKKFSKAIWDNTTNLTANVKRIITKGIASGSGVQKMVRELRQVTQKEKYVVERLVRTECKYFANQSELTAYKENGIKQYVFMGGTEGSISCNCKTYNNKIFNVDDAEAGVNFPPLHPNCKCCIRAYFENSILDNNKNTSLFEDEQTQENNLNNNENSGIIKENNINLTDDELGALNDYISSDSYKINDKLRNNKLLDKEDVDFIKNLDTALDKIPNYEGQVYRSLSRFGIKDIDAFCNSYIIGSIVEHAAYTSCSEKIYDASFPIQYVIQSKTGKDIRNFNENESEILFKRNASFLITNVKDNIIYMEEE